MDPDATLETIRQLSAQLTDDDVYLTYGQRAVMGVELAEAVSALDDWITNKKGFLPSDWSRS